ncbi:MAG: histidinol-phosphatase [Candidatus Zixiibacteriota bacterium]
MREVNGYFEYQGCIHIHTTASDGAKPLDEVAMIASSAGLDFIMVTDHMTLETRDEKKEGHYNETLVLIGYEHNDLEDCNHYLIFGSDSVFPENMAAGEYVAAAHREGALGIMAHPDEIRPMNSKYRPYPWTDWDVEGFDGLEIWNQMSEWMENLKSYNKLMMLFSPRKSLKAPTDRILTKWDELNLTRKVAGIAAADVHAFPYKIGPFKVVIFPYKVQFKALRLHLLLPEKLSVDLKTAQKQVYEAIRDCRFFNSNYRWGDAAGFQYTARQGGNTAINGGKLDFSDDCQIRIKCPRKGLIRLVGNGQMVAEANGDSLEYAVKRPGVYRVEVHKNKHGWIYSNHIRIGV